MIKRVVVEKSRRFLRRRFRRDGVRQKSNRTRKRDPASREWINAFCSDLFSWYSETTRREKDDFDEADKTPPLSNSIIIIIAFGSRLCDYYYY